MALWFDIKVNHMTIGSIDLQRVDPVGVLPTSGELCTYNLQHVKNGQVLFEGSVVFKYVPNNPLPLIAYATRVLAENSTD